MRAIGSILLQILKWILKGLLMVLYAVLGLAKAFLIMLSMVMRIFSAFVRGATV